MSCAGLVLDASIALDWAFDDEFDELAARVATDLIDGFAQVPSFWDVEVANALVSGMRRGRIDAPRIVSFLDNLAEVDIRTDAAPVSPREIVVVARDCGLTGYDAAYVILARDSGLPLATNDKAMRKAARALGVEVIG